MKAFFRLRPNFARLRVPIGGLVVAWLCEVFLGVMALRGVQS